MRKTDFPRVLLAAAVLSIGSARAAEPVSVELMRGGQRQALPGTTRDRIAELVPKLFTTCSINSRDHPKIFEAWSLKTIWADMMAKDHLLVRVDAREYLMGIAPDFPGPEVTRDDGRVVTAYVKCSGLEVIRFVCAPDVKPVMPASYGKLCQALDAPK